MFAQYTAGSWEYIGTQGVIQGTFETLAAIGRLHFNNSLAGRILLTAGMGGMGGNQPRAMTMLGGVSICADVNEEVIARRLKAGYCDLVVKHFDEAVTLAKKAVADRRPLGIAVISNAVDVLQRAYDQGFMPDIITDMTPAHDPMMYIPLGFSAKEAEELRRTDRAKYLRLARETMVRHLRLMNAFHDKGVQVFEYGNSIRKEARDAGMNEAEAMKIPGFVAAYIRPLFCEGRGPFRWMCLSRDRQDLEILDNLVLEMFPDDSLVTRWIQLARKHVPIEGLPARVCYLGYGQRAAFGVRVNDLVAKGVLKAPVCFSRDNLDSGSIVNPTFESEKMKDGSDLISDWPYLNALLNVAAGADLVAIHANYSMGEAVHTGVTQVADGSEISRRRLESSLTVDSGIGVIRHAQAGYDIARRTAETHKLQVPLWWTPEATFGRDHGR
jgi:urocanate hydratase